MIPVDGLGMFPVVIAILVGAVLEGRRERRARRRHPTSRPL